MHCCGHDVKVVLWPVVSVRAHESHDCSEHKSQNIISIVSTVCFMDEDIPHWNEHWKGYRSDIHINKKKCRLISEKMLQKRLPKHFLQFLSEEEQLPPLSTIEQRSLAILEELPFLIPFNTRVLLLRDLCRYSFGDIDFQSFHNDFYNDRFIVIRRTHLYEDAFEKISSKNGKH